MRLLLFRHGPAGDRQAWAKAGKDDAVRPLTADGREKTRKAAKGLAKQFGRLDLIISSPLKRAVQTATYLAERFPKAARLERDELSPSSDPALAAKWLASLKEDAVAVVGHEPHLSRLAAHLLTGKAAPVFELKKAGAALIELGRPNALAALLAPKVLRRLGR
ncbi:MAG: phosphohistidine phosphatase SixA [Elusimicrobia bacterium]|nr:phosphohistidine phosphatase SixA [Elusimicrobiota bacterium]